MSPLNITNLGMHSLHKQEQQQQLKQEKNVLDPKPPSCTIVKKEPKRVPDTLAIQSQKDSSPVMASEKESKVEDSLVVKLPESDDLDAALRVIARLETHLSDQSNESIKAQTLLRRELDASNEKRYRLEQEYNLLFERFTELSAKSLLRGDVLVRGLQEKLDQKTKVLDQIKATFEGEKMSMTRRINDLQQQNDKMKSLYDKKTKEWLVRLQNQQQSHTNQILGLSGEMESFHCEWKRKVEGLDSDLKRERHEKEALKLQLKLKQVQCEKSDHEAFNAKKLLKKANEEVLQIRSAHDRSIRQFVDSQSTIRDLQELLKKSEPKSSDSTLSSQVLQHLSQKVKMLERGEKEHQATICELREALEVSNKEKSVLQDMVDQISILQEARKSLSEQLDIANGSLSNLESVLAEKKEIILHQEMELKSLKGPPPTSGLAIAKQYNWNTTTTSTTSNDITRLEKELKIAECPVDVSVTVAIAAEDEHSSKLAGLFGRNETLKYFEEEEDKDNMDDDSPREEKLCFEVSDSESVLSDLEVGIVE